MDLMGLLMEEVGGLAIVTQIVDAAATSTNPNAV